MPGNEREIGGRIRGMLDEHGWTAAELGRRICKSPSMVRKYLRGVGIPKNRGRLQVVADALDVELHWLVTGEGQKKSGRSGQIISAQPEGPLLHLVERIGHLAGRLDEIEQRLRYIETGQVQVWEDLRQQSATLSALRGRIRRAK